MTGSTFPASLTLGEWLGLRLMLDLMMANNLRAMWLRVAIVVAIGTGLALPML